MKTLLLKYLIFAIGNCVAINTFAQKEFADIRKGNSNYYENNFRDAEIDYRKALEKVPFSERALFNLGAAMYRQDNFDEANSIFSDLSQRNLDDKLKAKVFHNLGNTEMKQENFSAAVEAYKNSLRINPADDDTRYNLEYALRMLRDDEQQNQDQEGDDNQEQNNDNQDGDKDEEGDDDKEKQGGGEDDKAEDKKDESESRKDGEMSKQEAERMLDALRQKEAEILNKMQEEKRTRSNIIIERNW